MDVLYHGIVGALIAKSLGGNYEAAVLAAMAPDLIGTIPFECSCIRLAPKHSVAGFIKRAWFTFSQSNRFVHGFDRTFYRVFHSFVTVIIVSVVSFVFLQPFWRVISLGYISHIILDIPTHDGDFTTYFFFPLSDIHWKGKNWQKNPGIFFSFWLLLLPIAVFILK